MNKYKNILVVADPIDGPQKALARALFLADRQADVSITVLLVIYDLSYEITSVLSSEERKTMQEAIIKEETQAFSDHLSALFPGKNFTLKVSWHNRPFEAILDEVTNFEHDLIIKSTHKHNKLSAVVFTPTDWHLLRKSPCPVLLVKDHEWPMNGSIVAAIEFENDNKDNGVVNEHITNEALQFGEMLSADIHLVNAYPTTPEHIAIEIPNFDSLAYNSEIEMHHKEAMVAHAQKFNINDQLLHIEAGSPEDVISDVVKNVDAELLILGAASRTGFSAFLIGNTAELVIDSINCDLLALK